MKKSAILLMLVGLLTACTTIHTTKESSMKFSNKEKVVALLNSLESGDPEPAGYINLDKYIQHNTAIPDQVSGLAKALETMAMQGVTMIYEKNHMILGEGNFVLAVSEGKFDGKHVAFCDLFRVGNGKIAEHWDVIQEIPPESEWKNSNGKF